MQAGSITCIGQRFALTRCYCSSQEKKPRQRKSKEERRAMVETFIINYQNTNKGSFPSLNLTHKEVGGSFYIVREIVRDIIQENRVLGPGDLDMQSLTLEDVPIQPEICEIEHTSTGAELQPENGSEEDYILVGSVNQGSDESSELLKKNLLQNGGLNLDLMTEEHVEQMEVLDSKKTGSNVGMEVVIEKGEIGEVSESNGTLPSNEAIKVDLFVGSTEVSDSNEGFEGSSAVENGVIGKESVMEVRTKTVHKSKSDSKEVKGEVLESNVTFSDNKSGKLDSVVWPTDLNAILEMPRAVKDGDIQEVRTEAIEKSNSEIKKEGRGESSESNGKARRSENKKYASLAGSTGTQDSSRGFETARAVVEVEQFPLPQANSSLNSEVPDSVPASASAKEREKESVEVKAPVVISKMEIKGESEDLSFGKSLDTTPKAEHEGATLDNATKAKGNRGSAEKKRREAENNPFWNTIRVFVSAIVKFWSE